MENVMNQDTPEALFETIGQYLISNEWELNPYPEVLAYEDTIHGKNIDWRILVSVDKDPEIRRVSVDSFLLVKAPLNIRAAVAELFARINESLSIGLWNLDMTDGSMGYGIGVDLMDCAISKAMFERMYNANLQFVDDYANTILSVVYGGKTPSEAFEAYQLLQMVETLQ
jgi:hypothetical protein